MSLRKASSDAECSVPIAESTHIDNSKTTVSPKRFAWGGRFSPRSSKSHAIPVPSPIPQLRAQPLLKQLDPQMYLDTQSNGWVSRAVKCYDESNIKQRPIANKHYNRPGDLPIVNLNKSEATLKSHKTNGTKKPQALVTPPTRYNSQASARSMIFRTGKNYGDDLSSTTTNAIANTVANSENGGKITAVKILGSKTPEDAPIVPNNYDYESNPTRSVLDALKEISRKRIHCDDLDGEFSKKQKADKSPNGGIQDDLPSVSAVISKRTRERTSPTALSSPIESQKKRYRNNDILSSLSSSLIINKRKQSSDSPLPQLEISVDYQCANSGELLSSHNSTDYTGIKARPGIHTNRPSIQTNSNEQSDTFEPHKITKTTSLPSKENNQKAQVVAGAQSAPKLTMFNMVYEPIQHKDSSNKNLDDDDDYENNHISFIKPKEKASTIFKIDRSGTKSKLARMLNSLKGDCVDGIGTSTASKPTAEKTASVSLSLATTTTVTFSTATSTPILSTAPSTGSTEMKIQSPKTTDIPKITPKETATISAPTVTTSTSIASVALPVTVSPQKTESVEKTTATTLTTEATSRAGGFSFPLSPSSSITPSAITPQSAVSTSAAVTNAAPVPKFSFGTITSNASTSISTSSPPSGFSFGATTNKPAEPEKSFESPKLATPPAISSGFGFVKTSTSPLVSAALKTAATTTAVPTIPINSTEQKSVPMFSFGEPGIKPVELPKNAPLSFGALSKTNEAPTTSSPANLAPTFSFSNPNNATSFLPASTNATTANAPMFSFGGSKSTTAPIFGSNLPSTGAPTSSLAPASSAPVTTTSQPAFSFGGPKTTTAPVFGSNLPTTNTSVPSFAPASSVPVATTSPPAFSFGGSKTTTAPIFGSNLPMTNAPAPSFTPALTAPVATTSPPAFSFGGPKTTIAPIFGSNLPPTNAPTSTLIPTQPAAAATTAQPAFSFGSNTNTNANNMFNFGQNASTTSQSSETMFRNAPKPDGLFAFGTNANTNTNASTNNANSSVAAAPAFGSTPAFGASTTFEAPKPNASPFGTSPSIPNAFGGSTNNPVNFGTAPTAAPTFGSTPTFGASTTFEAPKPNASPFGTSPSIPNAFGGSTNNPVNFGTAPTAAPTFGSTPTFGASTTFEAPKLNATPFGTSSSIPNAFGNSTNSPVSFGAAATATPAFGSAPAFGTSTTFEAPKPNASPFGASPSVTNAFGNSTSNSTSFGAATTEPNKPFNFGGASTNSNNMFGQPSNTPAVAAPFSFSAPTGLSASPVPTNAFQFSAAPQPAQTNIFSIGPSSASKGRPIRQATRRINK